VPFRPHPKSLANIRAGVAHLRVAITKENIALAHRHSALNRIQIHTRGNNDDQYQNDHACNQAHAHLHVFPPHLLAHSVGTPAETLGRDSQVVGLILKGVEVLATLGDLVDVLLHHVHRAVDLLESELAFVLLFLSEQAPEAMQSVSHWPR